MKYLNKLIVVVFAALMVTACDNTELDLQDNPAAVTPERASVNDLYNNIQLTFSNVFFNVAGRSTAPGTHARMYHMGSFNYIAASSPTTFNGLWFNTYSGLFPDIEALEVIAAEKGFDIHSGTAKIMKAYALMALVDVLNDVPMSQAGQGTDVISPGADSGADVYRAAVDLLDAAISQLSGTSAPAPAFDNFYGGDAAKWVTLANTLKLRAAVTTRLIDPSGATAAVSSLTDIIDDPSEDFQFNYGSQRNNPNSRSSMYNNHYEQGDGDYLSNYYMWLLAGEKLDADENEIRDPRIRYYFYRKEKNTADQDLTTYSCHFSIAPTQDAAPDHWDAVDSRIPYCIATSDGYSGRDHGNGEGTPPDGPIRTSYGLYPGGGSFDDETFEDTRNAGTTGGLGQGIDPIMLSSFVNFMKAEVAIANGDAATGRTELEAGLRAAFAKVESFESLVSSTMSDIRIVRENEFTVKELYGLNEERTNEYIDFVLGQYDAAANDTERMDVAMKEYFIALWGNGLEAYNMYRRTGMPLNMQPTLEPSSGEFATSFFLPDVHVNRNANATQKEITDRVFWDDGSANVY
ncbi:MAG: SusD/RagB family nutrient-binding outer membrane lipoprotein [Saprospiraceae bacterium]|nr:SusD/RagB family nutrient-binding outer membrane lipoprotein [Saprospiraceae bacterium]